MNFETAREDCLFLRLKIPLSFTPPWSHQSPNTDIMYLEKLPMKWVAFFRKTAGLRGKIATKKNVAFVSDRCYF